ncbi:MAG: hypothetical protein GY724_17455, partial [Actinomycetia bacterium]|nr:hypothetical protein [Actinomycetes bacterium]
MTATALQSGMLFHAVAHPGTGVDIEQISMRIDERLDVDRFRSAWATVIERHPILRAHFNWADVDEPELRYGSSTEVDLHTEDWSSRPTESQEELIRSCLTADRLSDFDLGSGPLHRFVVAELGPESWWVLWSFHHSILDGRSFPIVLREVFELYDNGFDLPLAVRPDFQIYVDVIRDQDLSSARAYWTKRLEHFETASSIVVDSGAEIPAGSP